MLTIKEKESQRQSKHNQMSTEIHKNIHTKKVERKCKKLKKADVSCGFFWTVTKMFLTVF